jgi:hypothetical protein
VTFLPYYVVGRHPERVLKTLSCSLPNAEVEYYASSAVTTTSKTKKADVWEDDETLPLVWNEDNIESPVWEGAMDHHRTSCDPTPVHQIRASSFSVARFCHWNVMRKH